MRHFFFWLTGYSYYYSRKYIVFVKILKNILTKGVKRGNIYT
jgi:hypothetical protein